MGLVKRRLYKAPRPAARLSCAPYLKAPIELPDAQEHEVSKALFCFCELAGIIIGDTVDYDPLRDEYTCIAKDLNVIDPKDVKIKDVKVAGSLVAMLISFFRQKRAHQEMVRLATGRVMMVR